MSIAPASGSGPDTLPPRVGTPELPHRPTNGDIAERLRCAVCTHDVDRHDAIGLRYCRATQEQVLTRGCICAGGT